MNTTLLYLGGVGFQEIIAALLVFIFFIAITICFFLLIRALVLWYWKITTIVENQQKQNKLLSEILTALKEKK